MTCFILFIAIKVGKECQNGEMRLRDGNMGRKLCNMGVMANVLYKICPFSRKMSINTKKKIKK